MLQAFSGIYVLGDFQPIDNQSQPTSESQTPLRCAQETGTHCENFVERRTQVVSVGQHFCEHMNDGVEWGGAHSARAAVE